MKFTKVFSQFLSKYCTRSSKDTNIPTIVNTLKIGDEISVFKTITTEDVLNFAKLTGDYNPIHIDTPTKLVHGALLNGLISGVLGTKLPGPGTIVVAQTLHFPKPCYAGDTIEIKVQVVSARKIVKCEYTCIANGENVVLKGSAKLIKK